MIRCNGLHIEMTALSTSGKSLKKSGWIDDLIQAEMETTDIIGSLLPDSHIRKVRNIHQTVASHS